MLQIADYTPHETFFNQIVCCITGSLDLILRTSDIKPTH